jgi:uncharacterized protein YlzI (FlbEa/FlbD family)
MFLRLTLTHGIKIHVNFNSIKYMQPAPPEGTHLIVQDEVLTVKENVEWIADQAMNYQNRIVNVEAKVTQRNHFDSFG